MRERERTNLGFPSLSGKMSYKWVRLFKIDLYWSGEAKCCPFESQQGELSVVPKKVNCLYISGFPVVSVVKNMPASAEDVGDAGSIPGLGRSLEGKMATHSSILA